MANKRSRTAYEDDLQKRESPYVFYGTPLPALDEHTQDDGSYVPVWKQEVTDDRGRKRLHGAFTGGFSAGYFNTVGSKEGWTPTTFKSSRQNRAKGSNVGSQQRPEDFMDEEDVREAEDAKQMASTADYAGFGYADEDSNQREALMDIFRPTGETIGVKLLKKMGWKAGQGVGPKVRRKADLDEADEETAEPGTTHLFAPDDPPMIAFNTKSDHKGLGFHGESHLKTDSTGLWTSVPSRPAKDTNSNGRDSVDEFGGKIGKPSKELKSERGGFGVGILNDTGSDDEDPYEMGPKISYQRVIGGEKKAQKKTRVPQTASNPLLPARPVFLSKKPKVKSGFRKCHDGRLPLEGFVLATELDSFASMTLQEEKYKPPQVPDGWVPRKRPSDEQGTQTYISTAEAAKLSKMDAKARAAVLGEEQMPGKSVFDFLTPAARDRIAAASGKDNLPVALGEKVPEGFEAADTDRSRTLQDLVPKLDPEVATQALGRGVGGWMPYAEDEGKRVRYRRFLEIRVGNRQGLPERQDGVSQDDWINEMNEFARAAQVFKPVTGLMATRFASSSSHPRLASDRPESSADGEAFLSQPAAKPEDAAVKAAKMGMFGPLTRSVKNFHPTRLLCKRFNVQPPADVQLDRGTGPENKANASSSGSSRFRTTGYQMQPSGDMGLPEGMLAEHELLAPSAAKAMGARTANSDGPQTLAVDTEKNDALEGQRPGDDVFKAIFGSEDEGDE